MSWDPTAWLADEALTRLSTAGRAIWFDLVNRMWMQRARSGVISGTADQLTRLARCTGLIATFFQRPEPHILAPQHEQIEGVKHDQWRLLAEALKKVKRGPAVVVQCDDLAVNNGVARQISDRSWVGSRWVRLALENVVSLPPKSRDA